MRVVCTLEEQNRLTVVPGRSSRPSCTATPASQVRAVLVVRLGAPEQQVLDRGPVELGHLVERRARSR